MYKRSSQKRRRIKKEIGGFQNFEKKYWKRERRKSLSETHRCGRKEEDKVGEREKDREKENSRNFFPHLLPAFIHPFFL